MSEHKIEVFRTGIHTAMNGETIQYTQSDIEAIAERYNSQAERKAPLVIGHPQIDDPAYGWVDRLAVEGDRMFAFVTEVNDKVVAAVKAGMFKMVSIALWPDKLLRHVGLLGAAAPAVAGLAPVQFTGDENYLEYAWANYESRVPIIGELLRGIRDFFIEQFGLDKTDKILPSYSIDRLAEDANSTYIPDAGDDSIGLYSVKTTEEEQAMIDETRFKGLEEKYAAMETAFAALEAKNTALEVEITASKAATSEALAKSAADVALAEFGALLKGLVVEGKVLPAEQDGLMAEFTDMQRADLVLQFGAEEKTMTVKLKERLAARPVIVSATSRMFASHANASRATNLDTLNVAAEFAAVAGQVDAASVDLDAQIEAYAAANNVSYEVSAAHFGASA